MVNYRCSSEYSDHRSAGLSRQAQRSNVLATDQLSEGKDYLEADSGYHVVGIGGRYGRYVSGGLLVLW